MRRVVAVFLTIATVAAGRVWSEPSRSGIDLQFLDPTVRAQDDFYRYVNGRWLASTTIPPDRGRVFMLQRLADETEARLVAIVQDLKVHRDPEDPDQQKIADLYASFMDEAALARLGVRPLHAELARIDALAATADIAALIAHFNRIGVPAPYTIDVEPDARDPSRYAVNLHQDGLGLPDRDYYLQSDPKSEGLRTLYRAHIEKMLALAGDRKAVSDAAAALALEREIAQAQWSEVDKRDPVKAYDKIPLADLAQIAPDYPWHTYLNEADVAGRVAAIVVNQSSYLGDLDRLLRQTPLRDWQAYFRWQLLNAFAPYLSRSFAREHFSFFGTTLRGVARDKPRWESGIEFVDDSMGEALGRLFVERHLPPTARQQAQALVANLIATYRDSIAQLDWMGPETKKSAELKLAKLGVKIGYPDHWRDYGALRVESDELVGNLIRAREFAFHCSLAKLVSPVDPGEWDVLPQTVNAHYDPQRNEIVFPAAVLQPPFFDPSIDDAVNYGAWGFFIAHEISHAFDDQGSQFDADGRLLAPPGWFTSADLDRFKAKTRALIAQAAAFEPLPGYQVDGALTLGENVADVAGLAVAYRAYQRSLGGRVAPIIDGFTGDQRFFIGEAQAFRGKTREAEAIMRLKVDPHPPLEVRGVLPEMNTDAFYAAFGVRPGDKMYLPKEQRITIW
jgi:putative endopeptidase